MIFNETKLEIVKTDGTGDLIPENICSVHTCDPQFMLSDPSKPALISSVPVLFYLCLFVDIHCNKIITYFHGLSVV